jgi:hypothetical protein
MLLKFILQILFILSKNQFGFGGGFRRDKNRARMIPATKIGTLTSCAEVRPAWTWSAG